jgi:hypothetical protein
VTGHFQLRGLPFLSQMKLGVLKLRNNGISISSKHMLVEAGHLQAANAKLANTKYEQIKNLNKRMITHHNTSKRLEFYELQDLITELSQWLNS